MSSIISMKALLESGVHFGHRTNKWNPYMRQYIFTERNGIHIIDLQQTVKMLTTAYNLVRDTAAKGGVIMFIGTKRQAQETIVEEAIRCGMPYVTERWLGGMLTNWTHHVQPHPGTGPAGKNAGNRRDQPADQKRRPAHPPRHQETGCPPLRCAQNAAHP